MPKKGKKKKADGAKKADAAAIPDGPPPEKEPSEIFPELDVRPER
jgi:hypothetical protein